MDNDKEQKVEVKLKVNTSTQIGIGIALLAIVAAGAGLAGIFIVKETTTKTPAAQVTKEAAVPGSFKILTPENNSVDNDYIETITWTAASNADYYKLYNGIEGVPATPVTVQTTYYEATDLHASETYVSYVEAYSNDRAITSFSTTPPISWSIAGIDWVQTLPLKFPEVCQESACGGQQACQFDNPDPDNPGYYILDCAEWGDIFAVCTGLNNTCPNDRTQQNCVQQTLCQCSGRACGGPECTAYLEGIVDPCL